MTEMASPPDSVPRSLVFGEVLYDVFPDGAVLGGAAVRAW